MTNFSLEYLNKQDKQINSKVLNKGKIIIEIKITIDLVIDRLETPARYSNLTI